VILDWSFFLPGGGSVTGASRMGSGCSVGGGRIESARGWIGGGR